MTGDRPAGRGRTILATEYTTCMTPTSAPNASRRSKSSSGWDFGELEVLQRLSRDRASRQQRVDPQHDGNSRLPELADPSQAVLHRRSPGIKRRPHLVAPKCQADFDSHARQTLLWQRPLDGHGHRQFVQLLEDRKVVGSSRKTRVLGQDHDRREAFPILRVSARVRTEYCPPRFPGPEMGRCCWIGVRARGHIVRLQFRQISAESTREIPFAARLVGLVRFGVAVLALVQAAGEDVDAIPVAGWEVSLIGERAVPLEDAWSRGSEHGLGRPMRQEVQRQCSRVSGVEWPPDGLVLLIHAGGESQPFFNAGVGQWHDFFLVVTFKGLVYLLVRRHGRHRRGGLPQLGQPLAQSSFTRLDRLSTGARLIWRATSGNRVRSAAQRRFFGGHDLGGGDGVPTSGTSPFIWASAWKGGASLRFLPRGGVGPVIASVEKTQL